MRHGCGATRRHAELHHNGCSMEWPAAGCASNRATSTPCVIEKRAVIALPFVRRRATVIFRNLFGSGKNTGAAPPSQEERRIHHYVFAHQALPELFFEDPNRFLSVTLGPRGNRRLSGLWVAVGVARSPSAIIPAADLMAFGVDLHGRRGASPGALWSSKWPRPSARRSRFTLRRQAQTRSAFTCLKVRALVRMRRLLRASIPIERTRCLAVPKIYACIPS